MEKQLLLPAITMTRQRPELYRLYFHKSTSGYQVYVEVEVRQHHYNYTGVLKDGREFRDSLRALRYAMLYVKHHDARHRGLYRYEIDYSALPIAGYMPRPPS